MNAVLVAKDGAPSTAFEMLNGELRKNKIRTFDFLRGVDSKLGEGGINLDMATWMEHCDVVLVGMSSTEKLAEVEVRAAREAARWNIPFGFYCDTWGVHNRPWFREFAQSAAFLFVINEIEAESAHEVFPNARVVVSGNPTWEDFFSPKLPREKVRDLLGVAPHEFLVFCPGGKNIIDNVLHWGAVIEAFGRVVDKERWKIFLAMHPGDLNPPEVYNDFCTFSKVQTKMVLKDELSGPQILPGADIVIESASTIGIEAACLRKPVIEIFGVVKHGRLELIVGSRNWPLCEMGAAWEVAQGSSDSILQVVLGLLLHGGDKSMARRQAACFPAPPEKGAAVKIMAETLIELARK